MTMRRLAVFLLIASSAALAQPVNSNSAEANQLIQLEERWNRASQRKDANTIAGMITSDYFYTGTEGEVGNGALLLKHAREGEADEPRYQSYKIDDVRVRIYGNTAVVTGRWTGSGTTQNKNAIAQERWTDVWIRHDDSWKCVCSQSTKIERR